MNKEGEDKLNSKIVVDFSRSCISSNDLRSGGQKGQFKVEHVSAPLCKSLT